MRRERVERARYRAKDQRLKVGTSKYRPCDSLVRSESVLSATVSTSRRFSSSKVEKRPYRGGTRALPSLLSIFVFHRYENFGNFHPSGHLHSSSLTRLAILLLARDVPREKSAKF